MVTYTSVITHCSLWTGQLLVNVCTEREKYLRLFIFLVGIKTQFLLLVKELTNYIDTDFRAFDM